MSVNVQFEWNAKHFWMFRGQKLEKAMIRALAKAGSGALRAMRVDASKMAREKKRFKVGPLNKSMALQFPTNKTKLTSLVWTMKVSGDPAPVSSFAFRQVKSGVSVEINRGGRKIIKHAFVATMKSGHTGIFQRLGKKRLPIDEAFTTRVTDVFKNPGFIPALQQRAFSVLASEYERLLPVELDRLKG